MNEMVSKELVIYDEKDILNGMTLGRPYRPTENSFLLLKNGRITIFYNLTYFTLEPSTVLHIKANVIYEFLKIDPDVQMRILKIDPGFESLTSIKLKRNDYASFFNSTIQNHYLVAPDEFVGLWNATELLRERVVYSRSSAVGKEIVHHLFLSVIYLLADVFGKYNQIKLDKCSRTDTLTLEFTKLVSQHCQTQHGLAFYANQLNVSPKHLSETIKSSSGFTAGTIINQAILTEAKILLSNSDLTIKHVAHELSFCDQYAFNKFFKRMISITPSEFRKNL